MLTAYTGPIQCGIFAPMYLPSARFFPLVRAFNNDYHRGRDYSFRLICKSNFRRE